MHRDSTELHNNTGSTAGGMITDLFKQNKLNMADRAKQPIVEKKNVSSGKWW